MAGEEQNQARPVSCLLRGLSAVVSNLSGRGCWPSRSNTRTRPRCSGTPPSKRVWPFRPTNYPAPTRNRGDRQALWKNKDVLWDEATRTNSSLDLSPFRQTFELGKCISAAGKSIVNLVKLWSLVRKYGKMWKIQSFKVLYSFVLRAENDNHIRNLIKKYTKIRKLQMTVLHKVYDILQPNFTILLNLWCSFQLC